MADPQLETRLGSGCGSAAIADNQNEVKLAEQTPKRGSSASPSPVPPYKSPRTHSPSSAAQMSDAGEEGRMETNRGETGVEMSDGATEAPALSPGARRKSWRRATVGRRSLPALPNRSQTLCRSIGLSMPPHERLEKLMEASMKLAIERTQNLLQSTPNASLESFQKQVENLQKEWSCVAKNVRSQPQCQQLPASAASDATVQGAMERTRNAIHRLQVESESWEALLNKHRSKTEALARKVELGQENGVTLDPTSLARSSQSRLVQSKPDYHSLLSRQQPILHTMEMVMDTQCKMVRELLSIQEQSRLLVKETSSRLAAEAGFQDLSSDLIRNLVAVPLSSATS